MKKVIFICTGNTCRSPMAEGIFKSLSSNITVESAGLAAFSGDKVCENAVLAVKPFNADISNHIARPLSLYMITDNTLFVCMTESHKSALVSCGINPDKIEVFNILDPYGQNLEVYIKCAFEIYKKCVLLLLKINSILIRPFKNGDETAIALLEKECFSSPWSENAVLESAKNSTEFFVAETKGKVVGYCGIQLTEEIGFVTNIAVNNSFRNKGIGTALTIKLQEFGKQKGLSSVSLEVRTSNNSAISVYEKLNFKNIGTRKNFYSNPKEDAFIYTYFLKD